MRQVNRQLSVVAISFLLALGCGCSRDGPSIPSEPRLETASGVKLAKEGPTQDEIARALQEWLAEQAPSVAVTNFAIEGQESFGNQVDPAFGQRFHATAVLSENLLTANFLLDGRLFATVATDKGTSLDIYGKIMSRRYQDSWKHEVSYEGNPFAPLKGETRAVLEKDSQATVIQIGTDAEAEQLDQWRSEGKITARTDVERAIVGTWDGECTQEGKQQPDWVAFTSFEPGGIYREGFVRFGQANEKEMESARGRRYTGTWAVFGRGVLDRRSNFGAENRNVERIVSIDATSYVSESGGRRCVWTRVDLEQQKAERLAEEKARADQVKRNESLLKAASDGDARLTQELVAEGADMAVRNSRGNTALMVAASYGHTEVIKVLLAAGADPNVRSHFGSTALSLAKAKRQVEAARILMDAGAKQ